ncbi:MAG: hypothetical protein U1E51_02850 [Candidatus Binatia bacterium]|nr:hypothetical protein [Candidatus Binatia bacterium]
MVDTPTITPEMLTNAALLNDLVDRMIRIECPPHCGMKTVAAAIQAAARLAVEQAVEKASDEWDETALQRQIDALGKEIATLTESNEIISRLLARMVDIAHALATKGKP